MLHRLYIVRNQQIFQFGVHWKLRVHTYQSGLVNYGGCNNDSIGWIAVMFWKACRKEQKWRSMDKHWPVNASASSIHSSIDMFSLMRCFRANMATSQQKIALIASPSDSASQPSMFGGNVSGAFCQRTQMWVSSSQRSPIFRRDCRSDQVIRHFDGITQAW